MAKAKSKEVLKSARALLKRNYTRGSWIEFPDGGEWSPDDDDWDYLVSKIKGQPNPDCKVCAEGAVYLACALMGAERTTAESIINDLDTEAEKVYNDGVIAVNDGAVYDIEHDKLVVTGLDEVLEIFEKVERKTVVSKKG